MNSNYFRSLIIITLMTFNSYGQKIQPVKSGKEIYEKNCVRCHGNDGAKGKWGVINLQYSYINDNEMFTTVSNGRRFMPSWKKRLSNDELKKVMTYIKTLRK